MATQVVARAVDTGSHRGLRDVPCRRMRPAWAVRGDVDGFVGLFIDNLLQLMLIYVLCQAVCGMEAAFVTRTILPGAAISILIGNLFYAWQARRLMQREGRNDVTAHGDLFYWNDLGDLFSSHPHDVFLVKVSHWFSW